MKSIVSFTVSSVSPGKPVIIDAKVKIPCCRNHSMPCWYFFTVADLFMLTRIDGEPDSTPRKTPLQPLSAINSIASSSELLHLKYENQLKLYFLRIIIRQISLKSGNGTLNVSSMNTAFFTVPSSLIESSSLSIVSRLASVNAPDDD